MATPLSPPLKLDFWSVRSEYSHILKANSRHFYALSLLFILPFSISLSLYPFLVIQIFPQYFATLTIKSLILNLLYILSTSIFFLLSNASITHSVFHSFYNRPIKLVSSIKAAFTSLFPLLSTLFLQVLIVSGISFFLGLLFFSLIKATQFLGFQINYSSACLMYFRLAYVTIIICVIVYLQVKWIFAYVIVVVESSWGFEPLKRSQVLIKGVMKGVAFKFVLFFGFVHSINTWRSVQSLTSGVSGGGGGVDWIFELNILVTSLFYMLLILPNLAANTILYINSKAENGDDQIAEDNAKEYVSLPLDDGKFLKFISMRKT